MSDSMVEEVGREAGKRVRGRSPGKTAATRRSLVAAGLSAFLDNGYSGTRMSDVASRAGVAKGTVYLHFTDKASLFAEVLREFVRDAAGGKRIGRPGPTEPTADFLRRTFVPIVRELQSSDRFRVLLLVITEGSQFPELAEVYRVEAIDPVLRMLHLNLSRARRRGELKDDAVAHIPLMFAAPVVLGAIWNKLFAQEDSINVSALLETLIDLSFT